MDSLRLALSKLANARGLWGVLLAIILGAIGVLAHAPFHIWPAFAVSICGLFLLLNNRASGPKPMRASFGVAWAWAFGYFLAGMFWVGNAFLVDAEKFAVLMPFAVAALPAGLALFWAIPAAIAAGFWTSGAPKLLVFVIALSAAEFARGHLLTGLPWNLPAYIWKAGEVFSQSGALFGPYVLSGLTLLVLAAPMALLLSNSKPERIFLAVLSVFIVLMTSAYGVLRLNQAGSTDPMAGTGPIIAAGQGGYSQKEVWDPANAQRVTQTYLDLLNAPEAQKADIVIFPEATFPFLLLEQPDVLAQIEARLGSRTLVLGAVRRDQTPQGDRYANSILTFDVENGALTLRSAYDKFHLVPFGEYLPFRPIFRALGIASLVSYDGEMTPGPGPSTLEVKGAPLADPRVCYEIIFPSFNKAAVGKAKWILNISIDAWYGDLLGPDQHYQQARMRAIETGRPLIRAASGGWSSITDQYGRALSQHPNSRGFAVARLPESGPTTLYDRFGDLLYAFFVLIALVFAIVWYRGSITFP